MKATLASQNPHKARELERALGWQISLLATDSMPPEVGETYYENALGKARFGRTLAGGWVLGEDSGIEVEGLHGRPGIHSARWAAMPVEALLEEVRPLAGDARRARYVCELVALSPEGEEVRGTGTLEGRIGGEPRGSEGFGYDPIFIPDGHPRTVAELGDAWKAENSHRARAARALAQALAVR